ncbi:Rrf2 family transcriptional regulator [Sutcliffiella horikoshii]|uniref:HTH-type transcriptional regulator NsrR n=1 Tax=Sutcliffiella horikoshii TaxID=79883 RepID=A0A5D4T0B8_9BACI|nr:Rrf2 family transcriptional regulator [Sutcliffiella horikoshii]TYS68865.1 Rrf2 family transcriptional regulator [Sutcliffiella horikoshii]
MKLTLYTDYSLRVLLYLASAPDNNKLIQIKEIAQAYGISKNHLMKVTFHLGKLGYVETIRGRNGGLMLAQEPKEVNIGELVRQTEEDFHIVECFQDHASCVISPHCKLKGVLYQATQAFISVLDQYSLEDLIINKEQLTTLLFPDVESTDGQNKESKQE